MERGSPPFTRDNDASRLAAARRRRARELRCPARSAGRFGSGGPHPSAPDIHNCPRRCPRFRTAWWVEAARSAGRFPGGPRRDQHSQSRPTSIPPPHPQNGSTRDKGRAEPSQKKLTAANSVRCPRVRGKVRKGARPRSQKSNDESELAEARASARGSCGSRREAPGGFRAGLNRNCVHGPDQPCRVAPSGNRSTSLSVVSCRAVRCPARSP